MTHFNAILPAQSIRPVTYDIIPSQLDESGDISIDKLTAYKTDLEYLDDHFQVHFEIVIIVEPYPLPSPPHLLVYVFL